ncbi:MAG: translin family protein [Euryarchaeota archaeon]|nr:translin family protein [Euryarchaeota archaeon]
MNNLQDIADRIESRLDERDQVREVAIKSARAINRLSGSIVHSIHKGEDVKATMHEALDEAHRLRSLLEDHPAMWESGLVEGALQELAEAAILRALVYGENLPDPDEMGLTSTAYLLGLADSIGELRRFALERLREGDPHEASKYLDLMEELFLVLMRFDYPDAIISIRRKQDVARSLLEKTRGEVAVALNSARLQAKLEEMSKRY